MSRVDIIVPSYNYAAFLDICVNSLLSQHNVELRVLIIDDASTDHTPEVCARLARQDARVEYRRHERNAGHIATFNEGLEWADSDYMLLLSADDWLAPGALARAAYVLDGDPGIVVACGNALVAEAGKPVPELPEQTDTCGFRVVAGERFIETCCAAATSSPVWTPTAVVRTSVQKKVGIYNRDLPHAGDLEMWLRFACFGSIAYLDTYQAYYRKHGNNMHNAYVHTILQNTLQHLTAFDSVFTRHRDRIADSKRLSRMYRRVFAMDALASSNTALLQGKTEDSDQYLEFAVKLFPEIRLTRQWLKNRLARILGTEVTGWLRTRAHLPVSRR